MLYIPITGCNQAAQRREKDCHMATTNTVTLSSIAKSLKMTPKNARRKMRTAGEKRPKTGWVFSAARARSVKKLLQS